MTINSKKLMFPAMAGVISSMIAFGALFWWINAPLDASMHIERRPGQDDLPPEGRRFAFDVEIGEFFQQFQNDFVSNLSGSWPSFRGPDRTNIYREPISLIDEFPTDGPAVMWRIPLGEGHAAPAIHQGRFYVLDYIEEIHADALRCFSLIDGKELWRRYYSLEIKRNHGYSRTIPAVTDDYVVSIGPMGHVMCVDAISGDLIWTIDMAKDYDAEIPQWYTGQCPLIEGQTVVLAPGGKDVLMIGVRISDGEVLWQTPNPGGWKQSHASVVTMNYRGHRTYVYPALGGIIGVAADSDKAGQILWKFIDWEPTVIAPSPVIIDNEYLYQSAGYGAGSVLVRITGDAPPFHAAIAGRYGPREAMATEQQSAIYYNGQLFGVMTKDAGTRRTMLVSTDALDPSNYIFAGEHDLRFGLGPMIVADDKFFALSCDGNLSLLKYDNNRFNRISQHKVMPGVDAWGPLAMADGMMLIRDSTSLACLDLTADQRWISQGANK